MNKVLIVIGFVILIIIILNLINQYNRYLTIKRVKNSWGKIPQASLVFDDEDSLEKAYQLYINYHPHDSQVDDLTWYDLDLFSVFQQLNGTYSSIGSEALYQRMRAYNFSAKDNQRLEEQIQFLDTHPLIREKLQIQFAFLGKKDQNFVEYYLNETKSQRIDHLPLYIFLGALPIIGLFLNLFFISSWTIVFLLGSILFNGIYYQIKKQQLQTELSCMSYFVQAISTAKKIARLTTPYQKELKEYLSKLNVITKFGVSFRIKSNSEAEVIFEYLAMIVMLPFIAYNLVLAKLAQYSKEADQLWRLLGELEVAAAVLNFRYAMPQTCQPTFSEAIQVSGTAVYHPLLTTPVSNEVAWNQNTLVSGSNASGKSTYVKSVAISCVLSATVHTALAAEFILPHAHVLTSMASEDNIFEGDSYFIAEIKSVKRVLQLVQTQAPCLCFIDEILKGTNTVERIAASSSIIQWLNKYPSLAFVATHDIELTEILKKNCNNVHFSEQVDQENGISFDYKLKQGPSQSSNAIKLLSVLDYPKEIVQQAEASAKEFNEKRSWEPLT
jgi:hypothetical protein